MARRKRIRKASVDATLAFTIDAVEHVARLVDTKWIGGSHMEYTWQNKKGEHVVTRGVPKGAIVVSDPAYGMP